MRLALATALLVATAAPAAAAGPTSVPAGPPPLWQTELDGPWLPSLTRAGCTDLTDDRQAVVVDASGASYVAGDADNTGPDRRFLTKFAADGSTVWTRTWDEPRPFWADGVFLAVRDLVEGSVGWVLPRQIGAGDGYEAIVYSVGGDELWRVEATGPDSMPVFPRAALIDDSDAIVVVGRQQNGFGFVVRHTGPGPAAWWRSQPAVTFRGARLGPGGEVVAWGSGALQDAVAVYLPGGGVVLLLELPDDGVHDYTILDARLDDAGNVYGTGSSCQSSECGILGFRINSTGDVAWVETWASAPGDATGRRIVVGTTGELFVGGEVEAAGTGLDGTLLGVSPDGTLQWQRDLDGGAGMDDRTTAVVSLPAGDVGWVVWLRTSSGNDFSVSRVTAAGDLTTAVFDLEVGADVPCDAAARTDGSIVVLEGGAQGAPTRLVAVEPDLDLSWVSAPPPLASPMDWVSYARGGPPRTGSGVSFAPDGSLWVGSTSGISGYNLLTPVVHHVGPAGEPLGSVALAEPGGQVRSQGVSGVVARMDGAWVAGYSNDGDVRPFVVALDGGLNELARYEDLAGSPGVPKGLFVEADETIRVPVSLFDPAGQACRVLWLDPDLEVLGVTDSTHLSCEGWDSERAETGIIWTGGRTLEPGQPQGPADCTLFAVDSDGHALWQEAFGDAAANDVCWAISTTGDRALVGGRSFVDTEWEAVLASFHGSGQMEWSLGPEPIPGQAWSSVDRVLARPDGEVLVAASAVDAQPGSVIASFDVNGSPIWSVELPDVVSVQDMVLDSDGSCYVASDQGDVVLTKLAADGLPMWEITKSALSSREVQSLAAVSLDGDGDVYLFISVGSLLYDGTAFDLLVSKFPGRLDLFRDGFETGDTSRWSSTFP